MRDFYMTGRWDSLVRGWELDGGWVEDHGVRIWDFLV
jgi:hypothetical protein